jgi:hypothetical protein
MLRAPAPAIRLHLRWRHLLLGVSLAATLAAKTACHDGFVPREELRERQLEYLLFATEEPISPGSILHAFNHLERARRDRTFEVPDGAIPASAWDAVFDKLWRLRDTSDFDLLYLINMLYAFGGHPAGDPELWDKAKQSVLDFKYWYTDPTPAREVDGEPVIDLMWYWSENHVLLFKVNEYLAGQRYPDETFTVTGMNGAWHRERARGEILKWIDERSRFGFSEWHSDVYYQKDITPLLSLVEWAEDKVLAKRAAMLLDVLFLDVALHLHRGNFGATHGRSYVKDKPTAVLQDNFHSSKLLFDDTDLPYQARSAADATLLARARKYRLPEVIRRIASYDEPMVDRERMNLPLPEEPDPDPDVAPPEAPYGLDFRDEENLAFWWAQASQTVWTMVPLTLEVAERESLWDAQFADFKPLRDLVWVEGDFEQTLRNARPLLVLLWKAINMAVLNEVNTYTYRTRDYMLSTAQDYRKGLRGSQTHISQATLGEHAVVFTQHPAYHSLPAGTPPPADWSWQQEDEPGPGYWTGNGSEPRAAQHENVAIHIYAPQYRPLTPLGFDYVALTHAYFPQAHFDEVVKQGSWTLARKDDAYVALYSRNATGWRAGQPEVYDNQGLPFDLAAPFFVQNVWIIEMGSLSEWGSFEAFRDAILSAGVTTAPLADQGGDGLGDGFDVSYDSPSQGPMSFGWHAPLVVRGQEVALSDYPRFDNPFVRTEFGETRYQIREGEYELLLDFALDLRRASGPRGAGHPESPGHGPRWKDHLGKPRWKKHDEHPGPNAHGKAWKPRGKPSKRTRGTHGSD